MESSTRPHLSLVPTKSRGSSPKAPSAPPDSPRTWTHEQVRCAFLREGELVPPARAPNVAVDRSTLGRLAAADALVARSRALNTRVSYGSHVAKWIDWAEEKGVSPLPAAPEDVAAFLVVYAFGDDAAAQAKLVGRVTAGSVGVRLAAINRLHELAGLPTPGSSRFLADMMRGLRRTLGTAPQNAKAALTWDLIERIVAGRPARTQEELRRITIVALHRATAATPGQLARLTWGAVDLGAAGAVVTLPPTRAGGGEVDVRLTRRSKAHQEATRLLHEWRRASAPWPGDLVFKESCGRGLSRQSIHQLVRTRHAELVPVPAGRTVQETRDRALLLVGWTIAQRRSNLASLNWDDVTSTADGGWRISLNRSKTDQEGRGALVAVPRAPSGSGLADPAEALASWLKIVIEALGSDPRQMRGVPLFCRVDNGSTLRQRGGNLQRLSGAAINEIVQGACARAGVTASLTATGHQVAGSRSPFGAHSLRSGFVTEGGQRGVPIEILMGQTGHKDLRSALVYYKPAQGADLIAATRMMDAIATGAGAAPDPGTPAPRTRRGLAAGGWSAKANSTAEPPRASRRATE